MKFLERRITMSKNKIDLYDKSIKNEDEKKIHD